MNVSGHGISIELPTGWEGRIYRRPLAHAYPILHAGSFAMPHRDGDFGGGAISAMSNGDLFVALLEYDGALAGTGLFGEQGLPLPIRQSELGPAAFQHRLPGRLGMQRFFTERGRPFCLYLVLGSDTIEAPRPLVKRANRILRTVSIDRAGPA
jgi:hypothetical protein